MKRLTEYDVFGIPVEDIFYDQEFNCRGQFTLQSVEQLSQSIATSKLWFPVVVQPFDKKKYRLLAGHRRYVACTKFLKWKTIPGSVRLNLTEMEARILNYTENLERKDLNIWEEATFLGNTFGHGESLREIANAVKRDTRWVHVRQKLLSLPDEVQQAAAAGRLSAANIERIWVLDKPADQVKAAQAFMNVRDKGKRTFKYLDPDYQPTFRPRKTKKEIEDIVAEMFGMGLTGGMPRVAVWAAGRITDDELREDMKTELATQILLASVVDKCPTSTKRK